MLHAILTIIVIYLLLIIVIKNFWVLLSLTLLMFGAIGFILLYVYIPSVLTLTYVGCAIFSLIVAIRG